jgi:hypothetical protein
MGLEVHDVLSFRDRAEHELHPQGRRPINSLYKHVRGIESCQSTNVEPLMKTGMVITVEPGMCVHPPR